MHTPAWFRAACLICFVAVAPGRVLANSPQDVETLTQAILHTLDYLAVDYPHTVQHGEITDAEEYAEQQEFAQQLLTLVTRLPAEPHRDTLQEQAKALSDAIAHRAPGERVHDICTALSAALISAYHVQVAPAQAPDVGVAAALFQQNCAVCHGQEGYGNGPAAATLRPQPSNFHARERQSQRSVYGLYNTITLGVEDTAMVGFTALKPAERWALAFYVSQFSATPAERQRGEALWQQGRYRELFPDLKHLTQATPAALAAQHGEDGRAVLAYLRTTPEQVEAGKGSPLAVSHARLDESLKAARAADWQRAYDLAVSAYLDGFELVEPALSPVDGHLKRLLESKMSHYRQAVKQRQPVETLAAQVREIQQLLQQATERLQTTHLSSMMGFMGAFVILVREGLEAILILAAIAAFLIKTGRRDAMRYIHVGWIAALAVGGVTWFAARYFIDLSGASRELTEGLTALFAAAVLIYVGLWLHNHTYTERWQDFLHGKMQNILSSGTLWSLALIAFIAVYREIVETVLFYETLWLQSTASGHSAILAGLGSAGLALIILAWALFRLSVRLPLRLFFGANAILLIGMAVVFAGKGIAALQEAGRLPVNPIHIPRIDLLGVYPTLESTGLQLVLLCFIILGGVYMHLRKRPHSV